MHVMMLFDYIHSKYEMLLKGRVLQCFAVSIGLLNILSCGLNMGWSSPYLPILESNTLNRITKSEGSWLASTYLFGNPIGAILACLIMDKVGRKKTMLFSAIPFLIAWTVIACAQHLHFLLLARFLAGVGDGIIFTVLPAYIAEIADAQIRGCLSTLIGTVLTFGGLLINILGYYMTITLSSIICAISPLIFILFYIWLPESPNSYVIKRDFDAARRLLGQIRGKVNVESEIEELVKKNEEELKTKSILDLFRIKSNRKNLFVVIGVTTAQQFSGFVAITFYTQAIFKEAAGDLPVIASTVILYITLLVFSVVSAVIVDRIGRRPLLIISISCCGLALLLEGIDIYVKSTGGGGGVGFSWWTIANFLFLIVGYSIGLLALPMVLVGELFSLNIKAVATCFCNIYFSVSATVVSKLFQFTNDEYGMHVPFFMFCICCCVSLVFVVIFVPETKRKTLEEIQIELKAVNRNIDQVTQL